jgi:transcriptional regulator GlxA family with amidase domain
LKRAETTALPRSARRAYEFIQANLGNPITLAEMAGAARCSPRQLQLVFRQCFNTTPIAMLRRLRLEGAAATLSKGDYLSVTEVALAFGYSNLGRFASDFRRQFACRPSEFARLASKKPDSFREEE